MGLYIFASVEQWFKCTQLAAQASFDFGIAMHFLPKHSFK